METMLTYIPVAVGKSTSMLRETTTATTRLPKSKREEGNARGHPM